MLTCLPPYQDRHPSVASIIEQYDPDHDKNDEVIQDLVQRQSVVHIDPKNTAVIPLRSVNSVFSADDESGNALSSVPSSVKVLSEEGVEEALRPSGTAKGPLSKQMSTRNVKAMVHDFSKYKHLDHDNKVIFDPDSGGKFLWDLVILVFICFYVALGPFEFAFGQQDFSGAATMDYLGDTIFIADIAINFRTGFYAIRNGKYRLVRDPAEIARHYIGHNQFWIDVVSLGLPYYRGSGNGDGNGDGKSTALRFIRLLKIARLLRIKRIVRSLYKVSITAAHWARMVNLFVTMLIASHLVGCMFYALGVTSHEKDRDSWIAAQGLILEEGLSEEDYSSTVLNAYFDSLYWALMTLSTVGYGDIVPQNEQEVMFANVVMVIGAVFYASWLGAVTSTIARLSEQDAPFVNREKTLDFFIHRYRIARQVSAEDFSRLGALFFTAMAWIFIPAYCFALP